MNFKGLFSKSTTSPKQEKIQDLCRPVLDGLFKTVCDNSKDLRGLLRQNGTITKESDVSLIDKMETLQSNGTQDEKASFVQTLFDLAMEVLASEGAFTGEGSAYSVNREHIATPLTTAANKLLRPIMGYTGVYDEHWKDSPSTLDQLRRKLCQITDLKLVKTPAPTTEYTP